MKRIVLVLSLLTLFFVMHAQVNLGVTEILPETIYYGTSAKIYPNVKVQNFGTVTVENFDVTVVVTDGTQEVYNCTETISELLAIGTERFITMNTLWRIEDPNFDFEITATVAIDYDSNSNNDELTVDCTIEQLTYPDEAYALRYVFYEDKTFGTLGLETGDYSMISDVSLSFALEARGADFANGVMYGIISTYGSDYPRELHIMKPNGESINLGDITGDDFQENEYVSGITYDYDTHKFYIITTIWGLITPRLYMLNQHTLEAKFIGQEEDLQFMSIEYADGAMYAIEVQQLKLHKLNMETGQSTEIGSLGVNYVALDQCLGYDVLSGTMYGTFYNDISGSSFRTINLETGHTTTIESYGDTFNLIFFAINADPLPSEENDIISFDIPEQIENTLINATEHTILVEVETDIDVTALIPVIEISSNATIFPRSGIPQDFTNPVEYTITSETGEEQIWEATVAAYYSTGNEILSFSFREQSEETIINTTQHTILIEVPSGTNVTSMTPAIEISVDATISPENAVALDFTNPVEYTVTAEDGVEQIWTVTVVISVSNGNDVNPATTKLIGNW
ncbi:MAG: hypothetical protein B6226_04170 [Candidatus Cloacimonetes bacterium 4572_65]|nr:MAG: hypothetical protein B6226_04170 [Candidatus Cloacimonetes bacterium 4572_65]